MSTQSLAPNAFKPGLAMSGKYDKRTLNGSNFDEYNTETKSGPKLKSRKDLLGRRAVTHLRKMDAHKDPVQLFSEAIAAKNYSLAWQIRSDVETRALGRPYVAINPEERRQEPSDISRIAVAIKNLQIVNGVEDRKLAGGSGKELPEAPGQVIEAAAKPGTLG